MRVTKNGDWLSAKVGNEAVMMNAASGTYIGLSEVGARIWELLDSHQDIDSICSELQREFAVSPDACRLEVEAFLKDLVEHGAVILESA